MSQCAKILAMLESRHGHWVRLIDLAVGARCYAVSERISELRRGEWDGNERVIENKVERQPDGTNESFYRLCGDAVASAEPQTLEHSRTADSTPSDALSAGGAKLSVAARPFSGELFPATALTGAGTY